MTITTISQLEDALAGQFTKLFVSKATINSGNHGAGFNVSYWQSTGTPAVGLTPTTTVAVLNHLTTGAMPFTQQASGRTSYLVELNAYTPGAFQTIEIHDRLMQISSIINTTAQTITGFDLNTQSATNNIAARIGDANYSDVQWWIENFQAGTNTAVTLTINVTYNDGTTGNLSLTGFLNFRQSRMFALNSLIPAADSGKFIRGINSVTSSATIGATGTNTFAFVATRYRASILPEYGNALFKAGWTDTGMPEIYNQSCLFPLVIATSTVISNVIVDGNIAHG